MEYKAWRKRSGRYTIITSFGEQLAGSGLSSENRVENRNASLARQVDRLTVTFYSDQHGCLFDLFLDAYEVA